MKKTGEKIKTPLKTGPGKKTTKAIVPQKEDKVKVVTPLKELVAAFLEAKDKVAEFDALAKPYKDAKVAINAAIMEEFKRRGEFTTRIPGATATLSVRKTAVIANETLVMNWLETQGLTEAYTKLSLNEDFDGIKQKVEDGEATVPGIIVNETEYVSVRANKKTDARRISTGEFVKLGGKDA